MEMDYSMYGAKKTWFSFYLPRLGPTHQRAIEVEGCADQGQVAKGLRGVAQLLAAAGNLLGEHAQMVGEAEHVLEQVDGAHAVLWLVDAGARHGLDEPESAHAEGALLAADSCRWRQRRVVSRGGHPPGGGGRSSSLVGVEGEGGGDEDGDGGRG